MDDISELSVIAMLQTSLTSLLAKALREAEAGIRPNMKERAFTASANEARRAVEKLADSITANNSTRMVGLRAGKNGEEHYRTIAQMVPEGCVVLKLLVLSQGFVHGVKTVAEMRALSERANIPLPEPSYYLYLGTAEALVAELSQDEYADAELLEVF